MKNIFYFQKLCKIGGTEQFLYEIAKKYKDYDITIYYDEADANQLLRLQKLVRCKKRIPGQKVKCDKVFFNFNIDMINDVEAEEYYFISHANYQELGYKPPIENAKLTHYVGVSNFATQELDKYGMKLHKPIKTIPCYNPLTLEPKEKVITLVSACRLDDKVKGGDRVLKLIKSLDAYCERTGNHYIWLIFTNKTQYGIKSPNVALMSPRIDVRPYIANADYVVQLSNDMETYCYTINEALGYGVPIVTTPLSIINELPIDDNMRIELSYDCSNVEEVARQIFEKEVKPFNYKIPNDIWNELLKEGESNYMEELETMYEVEALDTYKKLNLFDAELGFVPEPGHTWKVNNIRLEALLGNNNYKQVFVKVINEIKPQKIKDNKGTAKKSK